MNVSQFPVIAAQVKASVMDAAPHLAGMLMVMLTLTILWGVCVLTAKLIQLLLPAATPHLAQAAAHPAPDRLNQRLLSEDTADGISPELVAVIAAAVATMAGPQHRIVSIKPQTSSWEKAGRQAVLGSHRIR
jgi:glutaconyl-CoA decarboxylase